MCIASWLLVGVSVTNPALSMLTDGTKLKRKKSRWKHPYTLASFLYNRRKLGHLVHLNIRSLDS